MQHKHTRNLQQQQLFFVKKKHLLSLFPSVRKREKDGWRAPQHLVVQKGKPEWSETEAPAPPKQTQRNACLKRYIPLRGRSKEKTVPLDKSDLQLIDHHQQLGRTWFTCNLLSHMYSFLSTNAKAKSNTWFQEMMDQMPLPSSLFLSTIIQDHKLNQHLLLSVFLKYKQKFNGSDKIFKKRQQVSNRQYTYEEAFLHLQSSALQMCQKYKQCNQFMNDILKQEQIFREKMQTILLRKQNYKLLKQFEKGCVDQQFWSDI